VILAGDVGGTKCNLALFSEKGGTLTPVYRQRFASKEFAQFDLIVKEFSRQAAEHLGGERIVAAGFGIAGPVINGRVRATNLPWIVETQTLIKELNVPHVVLLNDLGAWGHSLEHLPPSDFCVLNPGTPEPGGTRALLAAGTGLGESILVWDGGRYRVVPSEGGHSDFAPHTEQQIELLRFMRRRYPQVSWELILSGRGFRTLHEFLAPKVLHASFEDPDADPADQLRRGDAAVRLGQAGSSVRLRADRPDRVLRRDRVRGVPGAVRGRGRDAGCAAALTGRRHRYADAG